ncbi:MAG: hypothetical protein ABIP65_00275, partial [Vicinamibacterales bacterium]
AEERWSSRLQLLQQETREATTRIEDERRRAEAQVEELRASLDVERLASPAWDLGTMFGPIDAANSVSETLRAIVLAAGAIAPRVALFIADGDYLTEWASEGVPQLAQQPLRVDDPSPNVVTLALRDRRTVRNGAGEPPAFAALEHVRIAVGVPLLLDGAPIGVLYGDGGHGSSSDAGWVDVLESIARHGATRLAYLTALRTAQAMGWISSGSSSSSSSSRSSPAAIPSSVSSDGEGQSARRYARLLISEIKLYNEAAVRTGRDNRDLTQRLHLEIDRARRLYEQRVPATVAGRAEHFHHELVQTLAGGDELLLG